MVGGKRRLRRPCPGHAGLHLRDGHRSRRDEGNPHAHPRIPRYTAGTRVEKTPTGRRMIPKPAARRVFMYHATDTNAAAARRTLAASSFGMGVPRAGREAGVERFTPDTLASLEMLTIGKSLRISSRPPSGPGSACP